MGHATFLKSQISFLKSSEAFQDSTLVCRDGVLWLNSLLTFLLFQEELEHVEHVEHVDEDLTVFLPELDMEVVHEMLENLLHQPTDPPNYKSVVAQFSLILPFEATVKPQKCDDSRKRFQRTEFECNVCGKLLKRTKWEANEHEKLHWTDEGDVFFL